MYRRYDFSNLTENETTRLRSHPLNDKIYGASTPDEDLQTSIEENGVFNPIIINKNKEILSGTRRWLAAKKAGFKKVPVITLLSEGATGLLGEQFLIESNRARTKTEGQKVREVSELLRIEKELAKQRMSEGGKGRAISPTLEGRATEKVAEAIGWGRKKVEQAAEIVGSKKALAAVDAGKSVHQAYRELHKKDPQKLTEGAALAKQLSKLFDNGEVSRSKKEGKFHLMLRDLEEKEIRSLSKRYGRNN
jgi:hypothetical protein